MYVRMYIVAVYFIPFFFYLICVSFLGNPHRGKVM